MASTQAPISIRALENATATATAPPSMSATFGKRKGPKQPKPTKPARKKPDPKPEESFDQQTLRDFELWLEAQPGRLAMDAHRRAHLRMILNPEYEVPRKDQIGIDKPSKEIRKEQSERWKARRDFNLNSKDQVVRNPEGKYNTRDVACTWDTAKYITERHDELEHPGIKKTFTSI